MFGDEEPRASDEKPASPRTTIVGGRPPESGDGLPPVPTGIEQLLRLAAVDDDFREVLIERRGDAAAAAGVVLTPNERAILGAIPETQIEAMAGRLPPPPPQRRVFLRQAAASAVVALGGAALMSCEACSPTATLGVQPDIPPPRPSDNEQGSSHVSEPPPHPRPDEPTPPTGIAPDIPPERPEHNNMPMEGGAAPDEPPPRPDHNEVQTSGGSAPDVP